MLEPERMWWFSVFLLLSRCTQATTEIDSTSTSTSTTTTTATPISVSTEHHDTVDIVQHSNGDNRLPLQTGQTTRIITSGEVDDNFWLKHLGEDFKNAIHLQIGHDSHTNVHSMAEDGSNYVMADIERSERNETEKNMISNGSAENRGNFTVGQTQPEFQDYDDKNTFTKKTKSSVKKQSALKKHKQNHLTQNIQHQNLENNKNIDIKYAPHQKDTDTLPNYEIAKSTSALGSTKSENTPIVVTLPQDEEMGSFRNENTPIVIKMPPVIYHQEPNYADYLPNEPSKNYTTFPLSQHQHQHQHQHKQHHQIQHYHQHQHQEQNTATQNSYKSQHENVEITAPNPIASHLPGASQPYHSQHSPLTAPLDSTQYYNAALHNEPIVYHSDVVYSSSPAVRDKILNSISFDNHERERLHKTKNSDHYILRMPSMYYNDQTLQNQISL